MKITKFVFATALILIVLVPLCVSAQNNKFYLTAKPGIYSPQTSDLEGFDTGFNGEISFGRQFNKNFAAEMGLGYFATKAKDSEAGWVNGYSYSACADYEIGVVPITLTLKGIYPIDKWEIYALGGVGLYFVSGDLKFDMRFNGYSFSDSISNSDTISGGHLGLGVHYNLTPKFFVGAETKYLWTSDAKLKGDILTVPMEAKFNLNGFLVTAVIGLRF